MNLSTIGHLHLLRELYETVFIPQAVFTQLTVHGKGQPGDFEVRNAEWIQIKKCADTILVSKLVKEIDVGEAEAIALALELKCDMLVIDERLGRKKAQEYHLHVIGTLGILLEAKQRHFIDSVVPLMDALRSRAHFWITEELFREVKKMSGE